jgi:adenosine deaminase
VLARRDGREPYDWLAYRRVLAGLPRGMARLERMGADLDEDRLEALDHEPDLFVARMQDTIEHAAEGGAALVEVRFGALTLLRPDFGLLTLFHEAELRARDRYPGIRAVPLISGLWPARREARRVLDACLRAASAGLAGVDFLPVPYEGAVDWAEAYGWSERLANAGLGITAHAGEFSPAHLEGALGLPGLTRVGHAVRAAESPALLDRIAERGITVECCLTSNVVYGAVESLEAHPLRRFVEAGVRVTLSTDNPVRLATTIADEYEAARTLGCSDQDLLSFARAGITASFAPDEVKAGLLAVLTTPREHEFPNRMTIGM